MYLQITTRCNMTCEHCIFSCGSDRIVAGDMSPKIFNKAIELFSDDTSYVTIGGGEPTLHKKFWEYLGTVLYNFDAVFLATNGTNENISLALLGLSTASDKLDVVLSIDEWHDPISLTVANAFTKAKKIRTVTKIVPHGSALHYGIQSTDNRSCSCGGIFIKPNGDVSPCACEDSPVIGNVKTLTEDTAELISWLCSQGECLRDMDLEEEFSAPFTTSENGALITTYKELLKYLLALNNTAELNINYIVLE